ncbi:hypothetical protein DFH09DRAFT_1080813 [Mycena vulgaris]|nr:hypothetical protein DFH09DRAFT_1080813 [Mycena vulgaris]
MSTIINLSAPRIWEATTTCITTSAVSSEGLGLEAPSISLGALMFRAACMEQAMEKGIEERRRRRGTRRLSPDGALSYVDHLNFGLLDCCVHCVDELRGDKQ